LNWKKKESKFYSHAKFLIRPLGFTNQAALGNLCGLADAPPGDFAKPEFRPSIISRYNKSQPFIRALPPCHLKYISCK